MAHKRKKTKKSKKKLIENSQDKQLFWILFGIIIVIVGFVGSFYFVKSLDSFGYAGVEWKKIKQGEVTFYHSQFPQFYSSGYHNLYLRENPKTNKIPVNINAGDFEFWPNVIVTIEPEATQYTDSGIANTNLGMFFGGALGMKIEAAVTDAQFAEEQNLKYATCADAVNKTVVLIQKSDSPSIEKQEDCYIINVGKNEYNAAVEKFMTALINEKFGKK